MNKTKEQLVKDNARLQLKVQRLEVEFRLHHFSLWERLRAGMKAFCDPQNIKT